MGSNVYPSITPESVPACLIRYRIRRQTGRPDQTGRHPAGWVHGILAQTSTVAVDYPPQDVDEELKIDISIKQKHLIRHVGDVLNALKSAGYSLSDGLCTRLLALAGEQ